MKVCVLALTSSLFPVNFSQINQSATLGIFIGVTGIQGGTFTLTSNQLQT
jgi:hypothetical protein